MTIKRPLNPLNCLRDGGEGGIRTHGTVTRTPDFESGTFDHSATSPKRRSIALLRLGLPTPLECGMHPIAPSVFRTLRLLGYGGLIPFLGLAMISLHAEAPQLQALAREGLAIYTVTILSFVGAVSWGIALASAELSDLQRSRLLLFSVTPSLLVWLLYFLPDGAVRWLAFAGLTLVVFLADRTHGRALGWPKEWLQLRMNLSLIVAGALIVAATGYGG